MKGNTEDQQEVDINHMLEDDLQSQLRQGHSIGISPSKSFSREASPDTDHIASSPPDVPVSEKSKISTSISKQPSSQKTAKPISSWLKKDERSPSVLLRNKFNKLTNGSPDQPKSSNLLQSRLPTYRKLSDMAGPGLIPNNFSISRNGNGGDGRLSRSSSSGGSDEDGGDGDDNSESESESASSSSSSSDTNEMTATQVWQKQAMSSQHNEAPSGSRKYGGLASILSRLKQPSSTA